MNINVFLLFCSFVFLQIVCVWERERERERERKVYKIGYKEKWSQSLLIFFFRRSSCGESFLFYGLIDFMLFLILAWRIGSFVSEILFVFFYPEYLAFGFVHHEHCPTTNFFLFYFRWREGVPTSVLGSQPIVWLLPSPFPCQATRVRSPSINIWSPPWPTFFLNGHSLIACYTRIVVILFLSSQWETTWHWVKASLFRSPGLFSVF